MRVNFVCVHILAKPLLFSAESIYNSRWCSDSPSNATKRSELRKEHLHLKAFQHLWMQIFRTSAYESGTAEIIFLEVKIVRHTKTKRSCCLGAEVRPRSAFVCTWWCAMRRPSGDTWIKASIEALEQHVTAALAYARQESSLNCSLVSATESCKRLDKGHTALLYHHRHTAPMGGGDWSLYLNSAT